ncbi:MAG: DUF1003 domain-containing protein [Pseudomonadota bacterium]|nr:DUF1003 domain-containing protein [Pseudomonadota bacterium]
MAASTKAPRDERNLSPAAIEDLDVLANFYEREEARISGIQLVIERISSFFGSPAYFAFALAFMAVWVVANLWGATAGWEYVDEPPFFWLQGIVSSNALLLTVAVLIRQTRMARLAEHRAHLDLQINLLTERKATKILQLVDELRSELPTRRGEPSLDAEVVELAKPADAEAILHAIKQQGDER